MTTSTVPDEKKLEVLNDHYKDTFSHLQGYLRRRNRLSLYLLLALAIMFLEVRNGNENGTQTIISALISKYLGDGMSLEPHSVKLLTWFFLFGLVVTYCQVVVWIERQYPYLHKLEAELGPFFSSGSPFTREGESYLKDYPALSKWSHILYTWVFPLVLLLSTGVKIVIEFCRDNFSFVWGVSAVFCVMIWITTCIYLRFRWQNRN